MIKGVIALDIDGTTAQTPEPVPCEVADYLEQLWHQGWKIVFVTGRIFSWACSSLRTLSLPYHLIVQNGAIALSMPSRTIIHRCYLDDTIFPVLEEACDQEPTDFVLYAGYEYEDRVYYRRDKFSEQLWEYVSARSAFIGEVWHHVKAYDAIKQFASFKCFGGYESLESISRRIKKQLVLQIPINRDPYCSGYYVLQATPLQINKGETLLKLYENLGCRGQLIAAGDDRNDLSMLRVADVRIVMSTAPQEVLEEADIVAPPVEQCGIIVGLEEAIKLAYNKEVFLKNSKHKERE